MRALCRDERFVLSFGIESTVLGRYRVPQQRRGLFSSILLCWLYPLTAFPLGALAGDSKPPGFLD